MSGRLTGLRRDGGRWRERKTETEFDVEWLGWRDRYGDGKGRGACAVMLRHLHRVRTLVGGIGWKEADVRDSPPLSGLDLAERIWEGENCYS